MSGRSQRRALLLQDPTARRRLVDALNDGVRGSDFVLRFGVEPNAARRLLAELDGESTSTVSDVGLMRIDGEGDE